MSSAFVSAFVLAALAGGDEPPLGKMPMVTLRIDGVHDEADGRAILSALEHIPNIKVATRPTPSKPLVLLGPLRGATFDLGDLARTVAATQTTGQRAAPSAALVLFYKHHRDVAPTEARLGQSLEATCRKLKGVDAAKCRVDAARKEVHIQLDGKGGAKWAEVKEAFPDLEVE